MLLGLLQLWVRIAMFSDGGMILMIASIVTGCVYPVFGIGASPFCSWDPDLSLTFLVR